MENPQAWARLLRSVRTFFDTRRFTEVTTDYLVPAGAVEGTIDPIRASFNGGGAELHTSPEIEMKRILSRFPNPIYQICKCFRDDPDTGLHRKEFSMLEFYRPRADYRQTKQDMRDLLDSLAGRALPYREWTVRDLVWDRTHLDLDQLIDRDSFHRAVRQNKIVALSDGDSWEDIFFKVLIEKLEPSLPPEIPVILTDYPVSVSVLSCAKTDGRWAERFEIYWQGMELCNGCTELTDAAVLRQRLEKEQEIRKEEGKPVHPPPDRLLAAMDQGLSPASGVAVGMDRLFAGLLALETPVKRGF
jgi:lysyl-tRNA synthetase class 2